MSVAAFVTKGLCQDRAHFVTRGLVVGNTIADPDWVVLVPHVETVSTAPAIETVFTVGVDMTVTSSENLVKHPSESYEYVANFGRNDSTAADGTTTRLSSGDTLTGTPTLTITPTGLTQSGLTLVSSQTTYRGKVVNADEGIVVRLLGGTAGVNYSLLFECDTTNGDTVTARQVLKVRSQ